MNKLEGAIAGACVLGLSLPLLLGWFEIHLRGGAPGDVRLPWLSLCIGTPLGIGLGAMLGAKLSSRETR